MSARCIGFEAQSMYEAHFGLSGPPFQLNPDPSFYFNSKGHGHALAYLRYGVMQGEGFIVVTGEIGAGKTTLLRTLLDELDRAQVVAAQIVSTQLESGDLLQAIITAFGIPSNGSTKATLISTLEAFLMTLATQGRRALLVIDEAQNLEIRAIEELRMLSNFQLGTQSLLQSFLVGQPELRKKLESPEMEQLRQRVTASCHLGPLSVSETRGYVEHRLGRVGWQHRPEITDGAFDQIYRWTGGVPRRINRLANRLLLAAFLEGKETIAAELVEQTAEELRREIGEAGFEPAPLPMHAPEPAVAPPAQAVAAVVPADAESSLSPSSAEALPVSSEAMLPLDVSHAVAQPNVVAPIVPDGSVEASTNDEVSCAESAGADVQEASAAVASASAPRQAADGEAEGVAPEAESAPVFVETSESLPVADQVAVLVCDASPAEQSTEAACIPEVCALVEVLRDAGHSGARPMLLGFAESTGAALKLASVAKALAAYPHAPRIMLFNPGASTELWSWDDMENTLPAFPIEWHLGLRGSAFDADASVLTQNLDRALHIHAPLAALAVGDGDGVLAASLIARKRGLPVVRLDAGVRVVGAHDDELNANLVEQLSDLLFAPATPAKLQRLYRAGIDAQRVHAVPATLAVDVLNAAAPLMTTPYGAFLRHRLPIFLGPRWSSEVEGTAYAVVSLHLDPARPQRVAALLDVLVDVTTIAKLIWLTDGRTREAIRQWQTQSPDRAHEVFLVHESMGREELDLRNSARVLCADIRSLPDYLSVLRGATGVLCEPGHVLVDAAALMGVPALLLDAARLSVTQDVEGEVVERPWGSQALQEALTAWLAQGEPPSPTAGLLVPAGASDVVAARLMAWLSDAVAGEGSAVEGVSRGDRARPAIDLDVAAA